MVIYSPPADERQTELEQEIRTGPARSGCSGSASSSAAAPARLGSGLVGGPGNNTQPNQRTGQHHVLRARRRVAALPSVRVVQAPAASTTLPDASVDVAHARWAYFFGPGCEPGLAELDRVMRPDGTAFVVDNDATRSTFGAWFRRSLPSYDPEAVERFWLRQGWSRRPLDIAWTFDSTEDFARVLRIEFPGALAEEILAADPDRTGVDYAVNLWWRHF